MGQLFELVETYQYSAARRSKSRNKVAVGEPAAGSLPKLAHSRFVIAQFTLSKAVVVPVLVATRRVTLTALIGGCLGSGVDEDRG